MNAPNHNEKKVSPPYVGFGIAGLGTGLVVQVPILFLLVYMTDILAIPAALAGLALFGTRVFDIITDPIMGVISDRTHTRWGRRRPYLLLGGVTVAVSLFFLFSAPLYESMYARLTYVMGLFIIVQTGVTIFMVPYYAMPAEMTDDNYQRTKLMSTRAFFSLAGGLIGGVLAPWIVINAGGGERGYELMSSVVAVICGCAFIAAFFGTARAQFGGRDVHTIPVKQQIEVALNNRPFNIFMVSFVIYVTGMGCFSGTVPYFARYMLELPEALSVIWVCILVPAILSIPLWTMITRTIEKKNCFITALGMMATGSLCLFLVDTQFPLPQVWSFCVIFGLGFGGTQVIAWSILPDVIQWDRWASGMERGGIFSGGMIAFEKTGFALGSLTAGAILSIFCYLESTGEEIVEQTSGALMGIRIAANVVPAVLFSIAALIMLAYPLTDHMKTSKADARADSNLTA